MPKNPPAHAPVPLSPIESPAADGIGAVSRSTLGDRVYERVRTAIIRGEIPAGAEINQVELANQLGVSRVPVREALRRLQAERLINANPFQRFSVTSLSKEQVLELFDLREAMEVFAALRRRARSDFSEADLAAAKGAAAALDVSMPPNEWIQADMEFHRVLYGRGSAVSAMIDEVRYRIYGYAHLTAPDAPRRKEVLAEHSALLRAMSEGDEAAIRSVLAKHVGHTRDRLLHLQWGDEQDKRPG